MERRSLTHETRARRVSESAWGALKEFNTIRSSKPKWIRTADKGRIKYGEVISGPMEGTNVVPYRISHGKILAEQESVSDATEVEGFAA